MTITQIDHHTINSLDFEYTRTEALADVFTRISEPLPSDSENHSEENPARHGWDLSAGMTGAMRMLKAGGWAQGAEKLQRGLLQISPNKPQPMPTVVHAVAGFRPDVPAYLAGDPDCMLAHDLEHAQQMAARPVIRIGVQIVASASCEAEHLMNRGIALVSAIDDLESAGYRVELCAIWACRAGYGSGWHYVWEHVVKRAEEHWTPASAALCLGHPAFFRRIGFAMVERARHKKTRKCTQTGYGGGTFPAPDYWAQFNLAYSDYLAADTLAHRYGTPELARQSIAEDLRDAVPDVFYDDYRDHHEGAA